MTASLQTTPPPSPTAIATAGRKVRLPVAPGRRMRHPRAAILAGFCLLSFAVFASTWVAPFTRVIGVPGSAGGDQTAYMWALEWPVWALTHGHNPLFSTYLNAPSGFNVMWTYPPLLGFVMAPATLLAGPVFSYNLLVTLGCATSGWLMSLAAYRFVQSWGPACAAGLLFGFGPYELSHALGHAVLVAQFAPPLLLLLGHEALVAQSWTPLKTGAAIGLVLAAQLMTFVESAAILGMFVLACLILAWVLGKPERGKLARHAVRTAERAALVCAAACIVPVGFMLLGPQHLAGGAVREPGTIAANVANFVVPSPVEQIAPNHTFDITTGPKVDANALEWSAYLGIPLIGVLGVLIARRWRRDRLVRFLAGMTASVAVLSLGLKLWWSADAPTTFPLPAALLTHVPLVENILWSRTTFLIDALAAVLLAVYLAWAGGLTSMRPRTAHRAAMALVAISLLPVVPFPSVPSPQVPPFFTDGEVNRIPDSGTVLVAPFTRAGTTDEPMLWQAVSGFRFRMTGGYVFVPGPQGPSSVPLTALSLAMDGIDAGRRGAFLTPEGRSEMLTELTRDHIGTVIVGPMPNRAVMVEFMTNLLGRGPAEDQGVEVWWNAT